MKEFLVLKLLSLQHELDHLDGVLALDRAMDAASVVARDVYERDRALFDAQVDYTIIPTLKPHVL